MSEHIVIGTRFRQRLGQGTRRALPGRRRLATHVVYYPRWQAGLYCQPVIATSSATTPRLSGVHGAGGGGGGEPAHAGPAARRAGIGVDSTGSTPPPSTERGACWLRPGCRQPQRAMFVLWKRSHRHRGGGAITALCRRPVRLQPQDGGIYSSEWFWAKILHVSRADAAVRAAACNWVELCDWVPAILSGTQARPPLKHAGAAPPALKSSGTRAGAASPPPTSSMPWIPC